MPNLMLTTDCNFRCPYCFGREMIGPGHAHETMTFDGFRSLLDWIDAADRPQLDVHLMGGEPTLNPLFGEMIEELARRGRATAVFSNLAAPIEKTVLHRAVRLGVSWIVNANPPETYRDGQLERLHQHLAIVGATGVLTFNITGPGTRWDYVLDDVKRFGLEPRVKIGITLPTLDHRNAHVRRREHRGVARCVMALYAAAKDKGIALEFECGVPLCLFSARQRGQLAGIRISHCGSRLDITPAGLVINCLPLCNVAAVPYAVFEHYGVALDWFRRALLPYRALGNDEACIGCRDLADGHCAPCLANALWEANRIALPPLPDGTQARGLAAQRHAEEVAP